MVRPVTEEVAMKLMVALDESSFAEEVLPVAAALAAAGSAELVLTTVVKSSEQHGTRAVQPDILQDVRAQADLTGGLLPNVGLGTETMVETRAQAAQRTRTQTTEYLEGVARKWFPQGAEIAVLFADDVAQELGAYARDHDVDIIAMATHGRTGLAQAVMGSVAGSLLRSRVTPVLLVRPNGL